MSDLQKLLNKYGQMCSYDLYKPKVFMTSVLYETPAAVLARRLTRKVGLCDCGMRFRPRHIQGADARPAGTTQRMRKRDVRAKPFCMNQKEPEISFPGAEKRPYQIRDQLELIPQQIKPAVSVAPSPSRSGV